MITGNITSAQENIDSRSLLAKFQRNPPGEGVFINYNINVDGCLMRGRRRTYLTYTSPRGLPLE